MRLTRASSSPRLPFNSSSRPRQMHHQRRPFRSPLLTTRNSIGTNLVRRAPSSHTGHAAPASPFSMCLRRLVRTAACPRKSVGPPTTTTIVAAGITIILLKETAAGWSSARLRSRR